MLLWYFGWVLRLPLLRHFLLSLPAMPRIAAFLARRLPRRPVRGRVASSEMSRDEPSPAGIRCAAAPPTTSATGRRARTSSERRSAAAAAADSPLLDARVAPVCSGRIGLQSQTGCPLVEGAGGAPPAPHVFTPCPYWHLAISHAHACVFGPRKSRGGGAGAHPFRFCFVMFW